MRVQLEKEGISEYYNSVVNARLPWIDSTKTDSCLPRSKMHERATQVQARILSEQPTTSLLYRCEDLLDDL